MRVMLTKEDYPKGVAMLPEAYQRKAVEVITTARFGQKGIRERLAKAFYHDCLRQRHLSEVIASLDWIDRPERSSRDPETGAREAARKFLSSKSSEELEAYCNKHSVSYSAFKANKGELIETLIDEMFGID